MAGGDDDVDLLPQRFDVLAKRGEIGADPAR
jgi:hypothetical protein